MLLGNANKAAKKSQVVVNKAYLKVAPLALFCGLLMLQACSPATESPAVAPHAATGTIPLGDTSRNALDWDGIYQGVLPCASCEGIETQLELKRDGSYKLISVYLGKEADNRFEQTGQFHWDEQGRTIQLDNAGGEPIYFRVEENGVRQLDMSRELITGPLADHYRLAKLAAAAEPEITATEIDGFTGIDWQLTELLGDTLGADTTAFVHFAADGRVYGNSGCNQFSGSWGLEQHRLRLGQMASTMRACPEPQMQLEQQFLAQLALADNYSLAEQTLSLNKARMAPLARFKAKP